MDTSKLPVTCFAPYRGCVHTLFLISFLNNTGREEHENFIGLSAVTLTKPICVNLDSELYASSLFVPSFFAKSKRLLKRSTAIIGKAESLWYQDVAS